VPPRIALALVLHNHQPVGNFGWVIDEVCRQAYEPMIDALERHPAVRVGLHYTGPLLEWLEAERPDAIERVAALAARGQVELLGGGIAEPILASLPERDRHAQLVRMRTEVERLFGASPRGAWLAERVWEPSLPADLARGGYDWTILDDNHLRAASVPEDEMWGAFTTDDQGERLTVFGTEQGLRYRIPFRPVEEVIDYLRLHATDEGERLGVMGDDGEKFGAWPGTFEHCWGPDGWVEECFTALEANGDWLETVTPSQWLERAGPNRAPRRIYVPTSSYVEMTQWALPEHESAPFHDALEEAREAGRVEARFLRGGFWRNFQVRYREVNDLHKQMLRTSARVAAMAPGPDRTRAEEHLHRGQSNDPYWHGLFGGVYLVHLRTAALAELIAAEDIADTAAAISDGARLQDVDLDGVHEAVLQSPGQLVTVDLVEGAGIGTWDVRAARVALLSVMARRPEAYHEDLRGATAPDAPQTDSGAPRTIHDPVVVSDPRLAEALKYDVRERRSGLVALLPRAAAAFAPESLGAGQVGALADLTAVPWDVESLEGDTLVARCDARAGDGNVTLRKRVTVGGGRVDPWLEVEVTLDAHDAPFDGTLALEWNVNLMGGGANPAAWYETGEGRTPHDGRGEIRALERLGFGNADVGVAIELTPTAGRPSVAWAPIETVSRSESGYELTYQGSVLVLRWPVSVRAVEHTAVGVRLAVTQARDRARDERGA
jgi:alpha-amylase